MLIEMMLVNNMKRRATIKHMVNKVKAVLSCKNCTVGDITSEDQTHCPCNYKVELTAEDKEKIRTYLAVSIANKRSTTSKFTSWVRSR